MHTDYLIVGAGAAGLAFADGLLRDSDAEITIVDRHSQPGGHWNSAYEFRQLLSPAQYFGVNTRPLQSPTGKINYRSDVLTYFSAIMRDVFLPTGRVTYLPNTVYLGDGRVQTAGSETVVEIEIGAKIVDATECGRLRRVLPIPCFSAEDSVAVIRPHDLTGLSLSALDEFEQFCVLGAGRAGIETALHLLDLGLAPDCISWVKPRDSWLINRDALHADSWLVELQTLAAARDVLEVLPELEKGGRLIRIFPGITPSMFHWITKTPGEISPLRHIKHVIRKSHVHGISPIGMVLDKGAEPMPEATLYIDCTASSVHRGTVSPVFEDLHIKLQMVHASSPGFSAAIIAAIELLDLPRAAKNELCRPLPMPDASEDYCTLMLASLRNQDAWIRTPDLFPWLTQNRLGSISPLLAALIANQGKALWPVQGYRDTVPHAIDTLQALIDG